jgi:hypothetical protein
MKTISENEVRQLRNKVYGHQISDKEWAICGENWMKPENIKWLQEQKPFKAAM